MKILRLLVIINLFYCSSLAQDLKKQTTNCLCTNTVNIKYPNHLEEDNLEGTVIVEYDIDSVCLAANPKIIQSLGPAFDKEALRAVNLMLSFSNKCRISCKFSVCEKRKVKFPLTFKKAESED